MSKRSFMEIFSDACVGVGEKVKDACAEITQNVGDDLRDRRDKMVAGATDISDKVSARLTALPSAVMQRVKTAASELRTIGTGGIGGSYSRIQPQQLQRPAHADDPLILEFAREMYHAHPTLKARRNGYSLQDFEASILTVWRVPDFGVDVTEAVGDHDNGYAESVKMHYKRLKQLADKTRLDQFVKLFHLVVEPAAQGTAKRRRIDGEEDEEAAQEQDEAPAGGEDEEPVSLLDSPEERVRKRTLSVRFDLSHREEKRSRIDGPTGVADLLSIACSLHPPARESSWSCEAPELEITQCLDDIIKQVAYAMVKRRRILPEGQSLGTDKENLNSALPANPSDEELRFVVPTRDDQPCSSVRIEDLIHPDSNNTAPTQEHEERVRNLFH